MNDIDAIRKLADAATDGPWTTGADKAWADALTPWALIPNADYPLTELKPGPQGAADAEFIAAARTHVPALCDEVEQLRTRVADRNASLDRVIAERNAITAERDEYAAALTESRANAARLANENGALVAENARVRQQRDELKTDNDDLRERFAALAAVEEYIGESCNNASHNIRDVLAGEDPRPDAVKWGLEFRKVAAEQTEAVAS